MGRSPTERTGCSARPWARRGRGVGEATAGGERLPSTWRRPAWAPAARISRIPCTCTCDACAWCTYVVFVHDTRACAHAWCTCIVYVSSARACPPLRSPHPPSLLLYAAISLHSLARAINCTGSRYPPVLAQACHWHQFRL